MIRMTKVLLTAPELEVGDYIKNDECTHLDYASKEEEGYWLEVTKIEHLMTDDTYTIKSRAIGDKSNRRIVKKANLTDRIEVLFKEINSPHDISREGTGYVYYLTGDKEGDYNAYFRLRLYKHCRKLDNDIWINLTELYLVRYKEVSVKGETLLKEAAMYEVEFDYHEPWDINSVKLIGKIKSND